MCRRFWFLHPCIGQVVGRNILYAIDRSGKYLDKVRATLPSLSEENRNRVVRLQLGPNIIPLTFYNQQRAKIFLEDYSPPSDRESELQNR